MSDENKLSQLEKAYAEEKRKNSALEILFEQKTHELYQANEQLKQQQKTIIKTEKLASIGQLAAGLAHEINNPLTFVNSNLDILRSSLDDAEPLSDEETKELIEDILEGVERIKTIVKNVNNFARTKESEYAVINLNQAVLSSLHLIKNRIVNKIHLVTDLNEIPAISGNLNEIKQAILNFLVNAIDAIEQTDLPVDERKLKIATYYDEMFDFNVMTIADNGIGIEEAKQLNVFDPFFSTKETGEGSGLGLYVCHEIIRAHGGSIDVESEVGRGTMFTIRFPVANLEEHSTG